MEYSYQTSPEGTLNAQRLNLKHLPIINYKINDQLATFNLITVVLIINITFIVKSRPNCKFSQSTNLSLYFASLIFSFQQPFQILIKGL